MGFYFRTRIKAGPFRFNLSKSGVGVSTGVPGFRVGTGPRGNYVRVGRQGVYYRASLGAQRRGATGGVPPSRSSPGPGPPSGHADVVMEDTTGATALELMPT